MKKNGLPGLAQYQEKLIQQLNDTVGVVRTEISKLQRATLEALIVLDVHAKEVVQQELIDK
jgi:dynein heavy chain